MKIIKSQSGDFTRAKGKEVMESFLKSPEGKNIKALFAHNDDMALGAIQAMEEAGIKPGQGHPDCSIDGVRGAFEAMAAGKFNCTVECNPLIGPQLFDAVDAIMAKKELPKRVQLKKEFSSNRRLRLNCRTGNTKPRRERRQCLSVPGVPLAPG